MLLLGFHTLTLLSNLTQVAVQYGDICTQSIIKGWRCCYPGRCAKTLFLVSALHIGRLVCAVVGACSQAGAVLLLSLHTCCIGWVQSRHSSGERCWMRVCRER
jgi:hypothetical protein